MDNEGARVFIYRISRQGGVRGRVHILIAKKWTDSSRVRVFKKNAHVAPWGAYPQ